METLVYVGFPTAAVLLLLSAFFEGGQIFNGPGAAILLAHPVPFAYAFMLSFLVSVCARASVLSLHWQLLADYNS